MPETGPKIKFFQLWENGWLYVCLSFIIYGVFAGSPNLGIYDWKKEIAYFGYLKEALTVFHAWPVWIWNVSREVAWFPAVKQTAFFSGNPEVMFFSPFIPLLLVMEVVAYIKIMVLGYWLIGVAGLAALKNKLSWETDQFRLFTGLFLFSPIIIQHLAGGFTPWVNLFFFPWLIFFLTERNFWRGAGGLAAVLALILLSGGIQVFFWMFIFLGMYFFITGILEKSRAPLWRFIFTFFLVAGLAAVRIFPALAAFYNYDPGPARGGRLVDFLGGALWPPFSAGLKFFQFRFNSPGINDIFLANWDTAVFWGPALIMFLILLFNFRNFQRNRSAGPRFSGLNLAALAWAAGILFFLSTFSVYQYLTVWTSWLGFPFLAMTGSPGRLTIMTYFILAFLSAHFYLEISGVINFRLPRINKWFLELIILGPLVLVSAIWLLVALSQPPLYYPPPVFGRPVIAGFPEGFDLAGNISYSPDKLIINIPPAVSTAGLFFPKINYRDSRFLKITSGNADFACSGELLAIIPRRAGRILVEFRREYFWPWLWASLFFWVGLLVGAGRHFFRRPE